MPLETIKLGVFPFISSSKNLISPSFGVSIPDIAIKVVVLPAPLAPINVTISPSLTEIVIPLRA